MQAADCHAHRLFQKLKTVQWSVITMIKSWNETALCTYQWPARGGEVIPGSPRSFAQRRLQIPPYPKPRLFNKNLLTPLHWGQRGVFCQVNRCNISKELYRRNRIFLPKNIVAMWVKDGQLIIKGTENKWNMKVVYRLFFRYFARTYSPTYPVRSQTGTALVSSSGKWRQRYKSPGSHGDPATKVQKQSNPPSISRAWN